MKIKSLLFVVCFSFLSSAFAVNIHNNPNDQQVQTKNEKSPGYCEIEVINSSYSNVRVYGTYDDGAVVDFYIYSFEAPHYINMYYYGYCHNSMHINISTPYNTIYSAWTNVGSTIRIVPFAADSKSANQEVKAEVSTRK